tara:strand:+ start:472 stop:600 length:129 start_codon:yes stop_codon:yes gene_type:complete
VVLVEVAAVVVVPVVVVHQIKAMAVVMEPQDKQQVVAVVHLK